MRKMGLIMGVAAVALLATACEVRFYMGLTVEEDGSGTMAFDLAADGELRDLAGDELDLAGALNADPENMPCDVTPLIDGDFQGARMICSFASLEELMEMTIPMAEEGDFEQPMPQPMSGFQIERDGDTFWFRLDASDLNRAYNPPPGEMPMELDLESVLDIRFTATLPGEIVSHNASVAEGNTLTWWFPTAEPWLMAESRVSNGLSPIALWALIAVGAVILVMLILRFRPTGKKESDPTEPGPDAEPAPKAETEPTETAPSASQPESETAARAEPETGEAAQPTEQTAEPEEAPATDDQPAEAGGGTEQPEPEQEAEDIIESDLGEEPERSDQTE